MTRRADPGEVALVLHTHLPYVRNHGTWPVGEEWLFQAWGESWLPVTDVLLRLAERGHRRILTLGVSPMVAHQIADTRLRRDLGTWLAGLMWQSEEQRTRYAGPDRDPIRRLAPFHWQRYAALLALHERIEGAGGLLAVWGDLERRGVIQLLGGPATHPYLPLVDDPAFIDGQLEIGVRHHRAWTGAAPDGLWAPECGYRPAGPVADPTAEPSDVDAQGTPTLARTGPDLPGLEDHYARAGVTHTVVDAATLVRGAGGAERDWTRRPSPSDRDPADEVLRDAVLIGDSDVAAFGRDLSVAYHVWSPHGGYPGDPWYRDFHARGGFGAHPSWRVTDKGLPTHEKAPYDPDRAAARAEQHADHLHGVLRDALDPEPGGIVVAAYDTELFGHWWLEGPTWLAGLLRRIADDPRLTSVTLRDRLDRRTPTRRLHLPESSWGYAKGHASWVTPQTRPIWAAVRRGQEQLREVVAAHPVPDGERRRALEQGARELLCAQASDWPFMVTRGEAEDYARHRVSIHLDHLDRTVTALRDARPGELTSELHRDLDAPADPSPLLDGLRRRAVTTGRARPD